MRNSALFRRDIRDLGSKLEREAGIKITSGGGISCFHGVGIRDSGFERGTEWDPGFQSLFSRASETLEFALPFFSRTLLSRHARQISERRIPPKLTSAKTTSWQKQTYCVYCAYGCASRNAFIRKKCSEPKFQGTWRRWKLWNKLSRVFTGHLLNMGMRKLSFTDMTIICAYLSATHWILLWPFKRYIFFLSFCVKFVLLIINLTEKSLWKVSGIWISRQKGAGSRD